MLALLPGYCVQVTEHGSRKQLKHSNLRVEQSLEIGTAILQRLLHDIRPNDLTGKNNNLSWIIGEEVVECRLVNLGGIVNRVKLLDCLRNELSQGQLHVILECAKPVIDPGGLDKVDFSLQSDFLALLRCETDNVVVIVHDQSRQSSKHLLEMLGNTEDVVAVTDDFKQIFITDEVETREGDTFTFQVFTECFLDLIEQLSQSFQGLLHSVDCKNIQNERRFVDLLHDSKELGVDVLETT